jgi:hypothetical protein
VASGGEVFDPVFGRVAEGQFRGERRKLPYSDVATFTGLPYLAGAVDAAEFREPRRMLIATRGPNSRLESPLMCPACGVTVVFEPPSNAQVRVGEPCHWHVKVPGSDVKWGGATVDLQHMLRRRHV